MKKTQRSARVLCDANMGLLFDDELERESNAETVEQLSAGDEYLDLDQLVQGVCRSQES